MFSGGFPAVMLLTTASRKTTKGAVVWRVLIVEDDPQMRDFFAASVLRCDQLVLAASLGTLAEARAWLDEPSHGIDVLLTDLGLPDGSGLEVIRHTVGLHPHCEALVISMFGDEDNVLASIEAGALGYIHKDSTPHDIAQTILDMRAGASPISPMIARRVLSKYLSLKSKSPEVHVKAEDLAINNIATEAQSSAERSLLSKREQAVLELIARGFSYMEIANLQAISVHTVQTHVKNLYGKLAVHSKTEAVFEATRLGFLS